VIKLCCHDCGVEVLS